MGERTPRVVILAGGLGTRMREETEFRPKPLVLIGNRPILWHIMKLYSCHGFNRFVICLGYKGEMIKDYFLNYDVMNNDLTIRLGREKQIEIHSARDEHDWEVTLVDTGLHTMTAARVKHVERFIDTEDFLLTYGDGVADVDVTALVDFHRGHGRAATITGVWPPSRFGELLVEGKQVVEFAEKPHVHRGGLINGGFFVMSRRVFRYLDDDPGSMLERGPLERLARDSELMVYQHHGFWQCMDTLRDVALLGELWESGKAPWNVWDRHGEPRA